MVFILFVRSRSRDSPISLLASTEGNIEIENIAKSISVFKFNEKYDGNFKFSFPHHFGCYLG